MKFPNPVGNHHQTHFCNQAAIRASFSFFLKTAKPFLAFKDNADSSYIIFSFGQVLKTKKS